MLAPSAFLVSAASTHDLQQSILPDSVKILEDQSVETTEQRWLAMSGSARPATEKQHMQRAWDGPVATLQETELLSQYDTIRYDTLFHLH